MGDGAVALILDVNGVAAKGHVLTEHNDYAMRDNTKSVGDGANEQRTWLLVDPGDGSQAAVQLDSIERLEEFPSSQIESVSGQHVVQYRGQIMPLVPLMPAGYVDTSPGSTAQVIVLNRGEYCVGVVVGRILDVVEDSTLQTNTSSQARAMTRVISGRVTALVDLEEIVLNAASMMAGLFMSV